MRHAVCALFLFLAACSSSDYERPANRPQERGPRVRQPESMLLEVLPADAWWRDPALAAPLDLSNEQFGALDRIATGHRNEITRLESDLPQAGRDLRRALNADPVSEPEIRTAAGRVRDLRRALFDRQAQMLSEERMVLTARQWRILLEQLQWQRERMMRGQERYPRGGRGGYSRGGRRPRPS